MYRICLPNTHKSCCTSLEIVPVSNFVWKLGIICIHDMKNAIKNGVIMLVYMPAGS